MTKASTPVLKEQEASNSTTTISRRAAHDFQRGCRTTSSKFSSKEAHLVLVQISTWQKEQILHLPIVKVVRRIHNSIQSVDRAAQSLGSHEMLVSMALSTLVLCKEQRIQASSTMNQSWASTQTRQSTIVHSSLVFKTLTLIQSCTARREIQAFWTNKGAKTQTQNCVNRPRFHLTTRKIQQINCLHHFSSKLWSRRSRR